MIELHEDEERHVRNMIDFCYEMQYRDDDLSEHVGLMAYSVQMFATGEKYMIEGLQKFAAERFKHHLHHSWDEGDFYAAVSSIYEDTSDSDRLLRDSVVDFIINREALTAEPWSTNFSALLDDTPGFAADAFRALARKPRRKLYRCPGDCGITFKTTVADEEVYTRRCRVCVANWEKTGKEWKGYNKIWPDHEE